MTRRLVPFLLVAVGVGIGCSGKSRNHGSGTLQPPLSITITPSAGVPADGTTAAIVSLIARDKSTGKPVAGEVIILTATGSGNVIQQPAPTDSNGRAQGSIASTEPGTKVVTATGPTAADVASATVTFIKPANAQDATLAIVSGDGQSAPRNGILPNPLVVRVLDSTGKPIGNVPVTFTVTSGGGVLSITNAATDANGQAATTMRVGPNTGDNTVTVIATGENGSQIQGSPVVFHETSTP